MRSGSTVKSRQPAPQHLKLAGAIALVIATGWFLYWTFRSDLPRPNLKPFASLGGFAAEQVAGLIGASGAVAIVSEIPDPKSPDEDPMVRSIQMVGAEVAAFREALKRRGGYTFLDELRLVRPSESIKTAWPAGEFLRFLQQVPDSATIVAFCYLPGQLGSAEQKLLRSRSGKLVLVGGVAPELKPLVDYRFAHLAIAARVPVPPVTDNAPETPEAWVRRVYVVLQP